MQAHALKNHVQWIRERLARRGIDPNTHTDATLALVEEAIDQLSEPLTPVERDERIREIMSEVAGLGPIQGLLDDPEVEEIWINSASRVFAARAGVAELTTVILSDQDVRELVERMLVHSGRRLDLSQPFVDATLRGGERLHVVIPPVTGRHWSVNIRKHVQWARSLNDLVSVGMVPQPMAQFLKAAVASGLSILVSGATQAGKTTLLRALAGELPRSRRVISCEEVFELGLANWDCVAMQTRPGNIENRGEITLRDLVRESLRMRPECIIVGEVRGPEALDLLLALNAGVPGMATVHANSAREALDKLTVLPLLAGENVTTGFVVPTLASSVDLVCQVERDATGKRRLSEIVAIPGRTEGTRIEASELWRFNGTTLERGAGGLDMHDRFAAAGFDLAALLAGRAS
ncbi:CpaF family protein [Schaalia vaccimaxillae]|uniref:CpaF family protein n=1 Tax=Schaalia vaccimaxillae TaxID=183916 RepID=UPI0003B5EAEA|nr:ATPase, T2SS/T4P/T4SS family [Schaalia vaccimaxillae]